MVNTISTQVVLKLGFVYSTIIRLDNTIIRYSHLVKCRRAFQQVFVSYTRTMINAKNALTALAQILTSSRL